MFSAFVVRDVAITIERQHNPALCEVPLILVTGKKRLRVIALDRLAHQAGVRVGITQHQAQLLCPTATIFRAREEVYRRIFTAITTDLLKDIGKVEAHYHPRNALWYVKTQDEKELKVLAQTIQRYLTSPLIIGSGSTKFVARVAGAVCQPSGEFVQLRLIKDEERAFLADKPMSLLPLDKEMTRRLPMMGIHQLGQYTALPRASVLDQFGKHGRWCQDLAKGIDPRPLQSFIPSPMLIQSRYFEDAITNQELLISDCLDMARQLIGELDTQTDQRDRKDDRLANREAKRLVLLLQCEDGTTHEVQLEPSLRLRKLLHIHQQLPYLFEQVQLTAGVTHISLQLLDVAPVIPQQLALFDERPSNKSLKEAVVEWQVRFHEEVLTPQLYDVPSLLPSALQFEYVSAGVSA